MSTFIERARGLLFIGDPHVNTKRIGRRRDDYLKSVLAKLEASAALCHEHQLIPVILGDLFHRNDDNNLTMLNRLTRVLQSFPCVPWVLEGNHDKEQTHLGETDALDLLALTGVVKVLTDKSAPLEFNFEGAAVRLQGCPYGAPIPTELSPFAGMTVLITHHDLAFGSAYPGALPLHGIAHCDFVVNGHMHDTKPAREVAGTWWHNPGNIEPLSVDLAQHIPRAWQWLPEQGADTLVGYDLPHGTDLFDLTGIQVAAGDSLEAVAAYAPVASEFAQLLSTQSATDAARTDDATILLEDLNDVLDAAGVSDASRQLMQALAAEMVIEATDI